MKLNIMTYNTKHCEHYFEQKINFNAIAEVIKDNNAEIIGLNEMRGLGNDTEQFADQVKELAERLGYHYYFAKAIEIDFDGVGGPYGNGLLSKYPILEAETISIPDPLTKKYNGYYETRCILKAKVDVAGGLNVLVSHFGLNPDEAENAVNTVIENLPTEKTVFMGDLNLRPEDQLLNPIREQLVDVAIYSDKDLLTFPSTGPDRKIDYIFVSKDIKVTDADVPVIVASDHCPHTAVIEV
ncbi:MAG: endonuclease/exonuclease/phosphatase family protein [Clostridia bacterium]|nr:endonuclease/exonuclease/phosphatase family protein [Clostridia bacterium]